jgi:inorganic triphosphatase YgiF
VHDAELEVELKLALPSDQSERLKRHPCLRPISPHRAVLAELDAIYFDTPELALQAQGVAVRLRQAGEHWVQTVKTRGTASGGLHSRMEWEGPSDGQRLDFAPITDVRLRALLESPDIRDRLAPAFRTRFRRWARLLVLPDGSRIELALDQGEIVAGEATEPISEVELELKCGSPRALFELALAFLPAIDLRPEQRSKAERGYALRAGSSPRPFRARVAPLDPELVPAQACAVFITAGLEQLERNLPGACVGTEPEFLHQARVALRRLRASLGVFRRHIATELDPELPQSLRWLMAEIGPARDWDVFVDETLPTVRTRFPEHAGLDWVEAAAKAARDAARARARRALESGRTSRTLLQLGALACALAAPLQESPTSVDEGLADFARRALRKRARGAAMGREQLAGLDAPARHAWRIALKKLRYTSDFLAPLLQRPGRAQRWIAALSSLQAILGSLNDAATTHGLLGTLDPQDGAPREACVLIRGFVEGACDARQAELEQARKHLARAPTPWNS